MKKAKRKEKKRKKKSHHRENEWKEQRKWMDKQMGQLSSLKTQIGQLSTLSKRVEGKLRTPTPKPRGRPKQRKPAGQIYNKCLNA